jgi:hypothetical protein
MCTENKKCPDASEQFYYLKLKFMITRCRALTDIYYHIEYSVSNITATSMGVSFITTLYTKM